MQNLIKQANNYTMTKAKSAVVYSTLQFVCSIYEALNCAYCFAETLILYL
jgi:hypothetical protein